MAVPVRSRTRPGCRGRRGAGTRRGRTGTADLTVTERPGLHLGAALGAGQRIHDSTVAPAVARSPEDPRRVHTAQRGLARAGDDAGACGDARWSCSRSRTAAGPTTRRSRVSRTPWPRSSTPWRWATTTSRPTCTSPRRRAAGVPRQRPRPGHRPAGRDRELTFEEVRQALVGGREQVPTLAQLFDEFPDARFNIDLKSDGAVAALAEFVAERDAWDRVLVGSFSRARLNAFRRVTEGRVATSASPLEVALFRFLPSGRLADRLTGRQVAALQIPHRRGRLTIASTRAGASRPRRRPARPRVDGRRPRRDASAARPRRRRALHRPDRPAQGRPDRTRQLEGFA